MSRGNWIYTVVTGLCRLVVRIFFTHVEVVGVENVPTNGPTLFVLNHPNGLFDPLFVLLFSGRKTSLLAKEPLFRMPVVGFFVRGLDSLPVYRKQDNNDPQKNKAIILDSIHLLHRGNAIALFPEGTSHSDFEIKPLRTGAARIALSSSSKTASPDASPVKIVPAGLYYSNKETFRTKASIVFGKPIVTPSVELDEHFYPPRETITELTATLHTALSELTLTAPNQEVFLAARRVERTLWAHSADQNYRQQRPEPLRDLAQVSSKQQRLVDGYLRLQTEAPERLSEIISMAEEHAKTLASARLPVAQTTEFSGTRAAIVFGLSALCFLAATPLLLVGFVTSYPTYRIIDFVAKRATKTEADVTATAKAVLGICLFPVTWLLLSALVGFRWGWTWFLPASLMMPIAAYVTLVVMEHSVRTVRRTYAAVRLTVQPQLRKKIDSERTQIANLTRELEQFLASQGGSPGHREASSPGTMTPGTMTPET